MDKKDKKLADESIQEAQTVPSAADGGTVSPDHSMTVAKPAGAITGPQTGIGIRGMEDIPPNMIVLPYAKIVQPSSRKTQLADGSEAPVGNFYFTDIQESHPELDFVILKATVQDREFPDPDKPGTMQKKTQLYALIYLPEKMQLRILIISRSGFTPWGRLIARMKNDDIRDAWEYVIHANTILTVNEKGKFYVPSFQLDRKLEVAELEQMEQLYGQYYGALDRRDFDVDETVD